MLTYYFIKAISHSRLLLVVSLYCVMPTFNYIHNMAFRVLLQNQTLNKSKSIFCFRFNRNHLLLAPSILPLLAIYFQVLIMKKQFWLWGCTNVSLCLFFEGIYLYFSLIRPLLISKCFRLSNVFLQTTGMGLDLALLGCSYFQPTLLKRSKLWNAKETNI